MNPPSPTSSSPTSPLLQTTANNPSYPFSAVTLAYFLRYPNPYSKHVLATDTLSRHFDPIAQTLTTQRLHLKRGKLPSSLTRFLPKIKESYILETSVVDLKKNEMRTETRNLEWEGVLSVIETQCYTPSAPAANSSAPSNSTDVLVSVKFESRLGHRHGATQSWAGTIGSWGAGSVQKSIEVIGVKRMREGLQGSRAGMKVVLEEMREKGLMGVMQERRRWREETGEVKKRWGDVWRRKNQEVVADD